MAKASMGNTVSKGEVRADFDPPIDPTRVYTLYDLPISARVTSVVVRYVTIPRDQAMAELEKSIAARKRHDAAVKANATRKAKKAEKKAVQP